MHKEIIGVLEFLKYINNFYFLQFYSLLLILTNKLHRHIKENPIYWQYASNSRIT